MDARAAHKDVCPDINSTADAEAPVAALQTTIADVGRHCDRVLAVLTPKQEVRMPWQKGCVSNALLADLQLTPAH